MEFPNNFNNDELNYVLAAEDYDPSDFDKVHAYSSYEEKIIKSLTAHGPVLLRGGRGCGKSTLMLEAKKRLNKQNNSIGVYVSLRYLPLLKSKNEDYEPIFCNLVSQKILSDFQSIDLGTCGTLNELQNLLIEISQREKKRIVIYFDDAAHIGRETSLSIFFDIFRILSSNIVSCKAAIYPGVTKFGTRFDIFNDTTVVDVCRDERNPDFSKFFNEVIRRRMPLLFSKISGSVRPEDFSRFVGRTSLGNMRAFLYLCKKLDENEKIGLPQLEEALKYLSNEYCWPLLEELEPKLGSYSAFIEVARTMAEAIVTEVKDRSTSFIIKRDYFLKLQKAFEILEYCGFLSKREASRALKSGGRGPRYSIALAILIESASGARLTAELYNNWANESEDPYEMYHSIRLQSIQMPPIRDDVELDLLDADIETLKKSRAYPYGLTDYRVDQLKAAGLNTISDLATASNETLLEVDSIGEAMVARIRAVVNQAVWM